MFKAGKFVKDAVHFAPANLTVKSGATVKVLNKGTDPEPHTVSFVKKKFLPKSFEFAAIAPLMAAHQVDPNNEEAPARRHRRSTTTRRRPIRARC